MAPERDSAADGGPQIREYADAVWRRRWLVLLLTLAGVAAAAVYGAQVPDVYAVSTRIDIAKQRPFLGSTAGVSLAEGYMESQLYYPTRYALLTSRTYVDRLLRSSNGAAGGRTFPMWDWLTWSAYGAPQPKADASENLGPPVDARAFEDIVGVDGATFARRFAFRSYGPPSTRRAASDWIDPSALAGFLVNHATVKPEKGTTLVAIDVEGERRDVLAPLLNLLIEVFAREQRSDTQRRMERERLFWRERRAELTNEDFERAQGALEPQSGKLQVALSRLDKWKHDNLLDRPSLDERRAHLLASKSDTEQRLTVATLGIVAEYPTMDGLFLAAVARDRESIASEARAKAGKEDDPDVAVDRALERSLAEVGRKADEMKLDAAADSPFHRLPLVTSDREFSEASVKLAGAGSGVNPGAVPKLLEQRNRIVADRVRQAVVKYQQQLLVRIAMLEQKDMDEKELRKAWAQTEELKAIEDEVSLRTRELKDVDDRLSVIRSQYEVERDTKPLRVIEAAEDPGAPVRPNRPLLLAIGGAVALLLGIGLSLLLELMDDTVTTPEDVERHAHAPIVGTIVDVGSREGADGAAPDRVAALKPRSPVTEAYRALRTSIEFSGPDGPNARIVLVTSATPQEGKTTVAANLATVLAQDGKRTLLVDADLRKPRLHKVYGIDGAVGLSNVLVGRAKLEDAIVAVPPDGLFLLPCGAIPPNPAELLGRPAVAELFARLAVMFDRVVVDTPPVSVVTDAAVLVRHASQTLVVVSAGTTKKRAVEHAVKVLRGVGVEPTGVVMNNVRRGAHWLYGSYYHPDAGSYYGGHDASDGRDAGDDDGKGGSAA